MARVRGQHVSKTRVEQDEYVSSVVGAAPEPTVEGLPDLDPTDATVREVSKTSSPISTARYGKERTKFLSYFNENPAAIFITIFTLIAVALFGFIFYVNNTTAGLNREVGELKILLETHRSQLQRIDALIEKLGDRVQRSDERINSYYERDTKSDTPKKR